MFFYFFNRQVTKPMISPLFVTKPHKAVIYKITLLKMSIKRTQATLPPPILWGLQRFILAVQQTFICYLDFIFKQLSALILCTLSFSFQAKQNGLYLIARDSLNEECMPTDVLCKKQQQKFKVPHTKHIQHHENYSQKVGLKTHSRHSLLLRLNYLLKMTCCPFKCHFM